MYDPDCVTDSKVFVNGVRLPVQDVDIHIRNEGPIDIGRYCEGYFASPWRNEDYLNAFDSIEGTDGKDVDEVYIEVARHGSDSYFPAFRGVVTGVGNAGGDTAERIWKFRAQGPAFFLDKTPVQQNFEESGTQEIIDSVGSQIDDKLPFSVTVPDVDGFEDSDKQLATSQTDTEGSESFSDSGGLVSGVEGATDEEVTPNNQIITKTFTKNRHTLADVANWLATKKDALLYFVPRPDGVRIQPYFSNQIREWDAHYLGGAIRVVQNDALSELSPINTLTVNGKAASTFDGLTNGNVSAGEYVQVKVRHSDLYERAGNTSLHPTAHVEDGSLAKQTVEKVAKKKLRNRITNATGGDMETLLFVPIAPFDVIRAKPTCAESAATDTDPIRYNVSRVHHRIRASGQSTTKLNVGVTVEDGDIEIVNSGYKEA